MAKRSGSNPVSEEKLDQYLEVLQAIDADLKGNFRDTFYSTPEDRKGYHLHIRAFNAGKDYRLRAVFGGNRSGKSTLAIFELVCHLTGNYPRWWRGFRFTRPIRAWCASDTLVSCRDVLQAKILGETHSMGEGMLPKEAIAAIRSKPGVPDGVDSVSVHHASGRTSSVSFLPYAAGREVFQGQRIDFVVLDEEPPWPIFEEVLMRTAATGKNSTRGRVLLAFTPLRGLSDVTDFFLDEDGQLAGEAGEGRWAIQIPWSETPHLSAQEQEELLKNIPKHQRQARSEGVPTIGSGLIYFYDENQLLLDQQRLNIPQFWPRGFGFDPGWRCSAAVFIAQDPDHGTIYVTNTLKVHEKTPVEIASMLTQMANTGNGMMSGCIDPAALQSNQRDGLNFMRQYQELGLRLIPAENAVEAGLAKIQVAIDSDQLKILPSCSNLLHEMRKYARNEEGKIQKRDDHLLDALRYIVNTPKAITRARPTGYRPKVRGSFVTSGPYA